MASGTHGMTPGSGDPHLLQERQHRLESFQRRGRVRQGELQEPEHGPVAARVEGVLVAQGLAKPFLRVRTRRVHVAAERRHQRLGEQHVAHAQQPPRLDVDVGGLLGVPGGDIPVPRPAFHLGQVGEELAPYHIPSQPLVLGQLLVEDLPCGVQLACPQQLESVTGPGRGEDGCLAPRLLPHRQVLQPHGLGHEVPCRTAHQELDHGEGGQRFGPDRGMGDPPRPPPGRARALPGEGEVTAVDPHPRQVLEARRPDRRVIPRLPQGLLREPLDAGQVEPADGGQVQEDTGAVTAGRRRGDRLVQQRRRADRVAGVEVVPGRLDASSEQAGAVLWRCQLPGQLQQVGGGVRGSPRPRVPARLLQRPCHLEVGSAGREGEVPSLLLRVDDEIRQAAMHAPSGLLRRRGVDRRPQERMGEPDAAAGPLEDARLLGSLDAGRCPLPSCRRRGDQVFCRAGGRRHDEEPIGGARRQRGKPCPEQLLEVLGDGERLAGCRPDSLPGKGPGDLEGEQRVPFRDPVEPEQDGTVEVPPGPSSQEAGHRLLGQRAEGHPVEARGRPCPTQSERVTAGTGAQATRIRIGASSRRRTTNASTLADGVSSHWTSSIAMISGADAASARRTPRDASDTARWSGGAPSTSARRSAASSARRCGAGRSGSSKSNRSPSAA
jgi:hypothetical protein